MTAKMLLPSWQVRLAARAALLGLLSLVAIGVATTLLGESFGGSSESRSLARSASWRAVPLLARGAISAEIGERDPAYALHPVGGGWRATSPAESLGLAFAERGVTVTSGAATLRLRLTAIGGGQSLTPVAEVDPALVGSHVVYDHPDVREWYANGPLGLEQGFTVARRPSRSPTTLQLMVDVGGNVSAAQRGGAVVFSRDGRAVLAERELEVTDAQGHSLPARLGIRHGQLVIAIDDRHARFPLRVDPFVEQATLTDPSGSSGYQLGHSIAVSADGSIVAVGEPSGDGADKYHAGGGQVLVFSRPAGGWSQQLAAPAALTVSDEAQSDNIGTSVAISADGDTIVAGAHNSAAAAGFAYVYATSAETWRSTASPAATFMVANNASPNYSNQFGYSVATSEDGSTIAVGAPQEQVGTNGEQGAIYVYSRIGSTWTTSAEAAAATLTARDGAAGDLFGNSVAISASGSVIAGGAPGAGVATSQGEAFVFTRPGTSWSSEYEAADLTAADAAAGDELGSSISLSQDGSTLITGAPDAKVSSAAEAGAAYIFTERNGTWATTSTAAELSESAPVANDHFGTSVALTDAGPTALVGANGDSSYAGSAYLYTLESGGWTQTSAIANPVPGAGSNFGEAAAMSSDATTVAAGAPGEAYAGEGSRGEAFVFGSGAASATSTTTLKASTRAAVTSQTVTFTASVTPVGSAGTVAFSAGGAALPGCGAVAVRSGTAVCRAAFGAPGTQAVRARFAGTSTVAASTSAILAMTVSDSVTLSGSPSGAAGSVTFTVSCAAQSNGCRVTSSVYVTEAVKGGKVIAVTARSTRKRMVLIGRKTSEIRAGKRLKITIALNGTGRSLLKRFRALPAKLEVMLTAAAKTSTVTTRRVTIHSPKAKARARIV